MIKFSKTSHIYSRDTINSALSNQCILKSLPHSSLLQPTVIINTNDTNRKICSTGPKFITKRCTWLEFILASSISRTSLLEVQRERERCRKNSKQKKKKITARRTRTFQCNNRDDEILYSLPWYGISVTQEEGNVFYSVPTGYDHDEETMSNGWWWLANVWTESSCCFSQ